MLHHVSFNARNPAIAAAGLADLMKGRALRAPHPPFPSEAWFVCTGDDSGTLIEVMPWGETRDSTAPRGTGHDPEMRPCSGSHVLVSTPLAADAIFTIAGRLHWRAEQADAGMFKFIKVWVENAFLVEFLTPDTIPAYIAAFGSTGLPRLDEELRSLEKTLRSR